MYFRFQCVGKQKKKQGNKQNATWQILRASWKKLSRSWRKLRKTSSTSGETLSVQMVKHNLLLTVCLVSTLVLFASGFAVSWKWSLCNIGIDQVFLTTCNFCKCYSHFPAADQVFFIFNRRFRLSWHERFRDGRILENCFAKIHFATLLLLSYVFAQVYFKDWNWEFTQTLSINFSLTLAPRQRLWS